MKRRLFLLGAASLLAAPSIVRAGSIMPVRAMPSERSIEQMLLDGFNLPDPATYLFNTADGVCSIICNDGDRPLTLVPPSTGRVIAPHDVTIAPGDTVVFYHHVEVGVDEGGFYRKAGGIKVRG